MIGECDFVLYAALPQRVNIIVMNRARLTLFVEFYVCMIWKNLKTLGCCI